MAMKISDVRDMYPRARFCFFDSDDFESIKNPFYHSEVSHINAKVDEDGYGFVFIYVKQK